MIPTHSSVAYFSRQIHSRAEQDVRPPQVGRVAFGSPGKDTSGYADLSPRPIGEFRVKGKLLNTENLGPGVAGELLRISIGITQD